MNRQLLLLPLVAGFGVALLVSHQHQQAPARELVVADPDLSRVVAPAAPRAPEVVMPGIAIVRPTPSQGGKAKKLLPPTPDADHTDPYTGEDITTEVEQVIASRALPIDRVDPWNPATVYPSTPGPDIILNPASPWLGASEHNPERVAKNAKNAPKKTLSEDDPWAVTPPSLSL